MTRLSVIIPGYNTPEVWWWRCLKSVCAACGPDDEIICVDDGSKECPCFLNDIAKEDVRVKPIFLLQNVGQSAARNAALDEAKGEWIAFVDSDDEVIPDIYEKCFNAVAENTTDIVLFGVRVIWANEKLYKDDIPWKRDASKLLDKNEVKRLFDGCLFEYPVNRLYRKTFLAENNIRFDTGICPGEDTIFNLKCLLKGARFVFVPSVGYVYYRFFTSSLARYQPRFGDSLRMRNELWRRFKSLCNVSDNEVNLGEIDEAELMCWEMKNIWRYDSPVTLGGRWRWLKTNARYFTSPAWAIFIKELLGGFVRRYLYFRPIRRWKIKRMFPNVKEMQ